MDPQTSHEQQQLSDSLALHTIHNLLPPKNPVRLSEHIETFIKHILKEDVSTLLAKPSIKAPASRSDLPLADYFVSSSHNTYLLSNQVLGKSSALSYANVLSRGARCVEIDVWPSSKGPIVTHGHTFSQSIPFVDVCVAIGDSVRPEMWPVLVSLECHVYGEDNQTELIKIMRDTWGARFVDGRLDDVKDNPTVEALMGRILVAVEYYPPPLSVLLDSCDDEAQPPPSSSSSSSSSDSEPNSFWTRRRTRVPRHLRISPILATAGYYLRSMKPSHGNWFTNLFREPLNIMINISESAISSILTNSTSDLGALITHAQTHIRRVYPKGLRLTSSNLRPYKFWGNGSHLVSLNWQRYDLGIQINEAMFVGTPGWVVKPKWMREPIQDKDNSGGPSDKRLRIKGEIVGVCSTPPPSDRKRTADSKPYDAYIKAQLFLPSPSAIPPSSENLPAIQTTTEFEHRSETRRVKPLTGDIDFAYPPSDNNDGRLLLAEQCDASRWGKRHENGGLGNFSFEWEVLEKWEDLTFLRLSVCEEELGKDDTLAIFCARLADLRRALAVDGEVESNGTSISGWKGVRMLDLKGKACGTVALVRFTVHLVDV